MRVVAIVLCALFASTGIVVLGDEEWDKNEARVVREQVYSGIARLSDFPQVKATLDAALASDPASAPALVLLLKHANEDVASTAAQALGRFPGGVNAAALRSTYGTEQRVMVRINALAGLARMKDPEAGTLARAALFDQDEMIQGGGLGALEKLGDSANSAAILSYMDRQATGYAPSLFEILGKLGDPPGSTAVRDRLLSEANNKGKNFDTRLEAARGLETMGQAALVQHVLDLGVADETSQSLPVVAGAMQRYALTKGVVINGQGAVEGVLQGADLGRDRLDGWDRPFRARFVSVGVFDVVSDGPDKVPNTPDDLSSAEPFGAYQKRVFGDLF
jgi:hypothetical protein